MSRGQRIDVYDLRLDRRIASLRDAALEIPAAHHDVVQSLAFSKNGTLASGGFRIAKLWQRSPFKSATPISFPANPVSFAVSPEGDSIAAGLSDGSIALVDLKRIDNPPVTYRDHKTEVISLTFSADSTWLYSAARDRTLNRRSLTKTNEANQVATPTAASPLVLMPEKAMLIAACEDHHLKIFSAELEPLANQVPVPIEKSPVIGLIAVPGQPGDFILAHRNGVIVRLRFDPAQPAKKHEEIWRIAQGAEIRDAALSESRIAAVAPSGTIVLWDATDGKKITELKGDPNLPVRLHVLNQKATVTARLKTYWDKKAPDAEKLWKSESGKAAQSGEAIAKARRDIAAKQVVLTALQAKAPPATQEEMDKAKAELKTAQQSLTSALRNRDASSRLAGDALTRHNLALAQAKEAQVLTETLKTEAAELQKKIDQPGEAAKITALAFSRGGNILTAALDNGRLRLWSALDGTWLEDTASTGIGSTGGVFFFTGPHQFFTADKENCFVPQTLPGASWQLAGTLGDGHLPDPFPDRVSALAFHPEGDWLLVGSGVPSRSGEISLWESANSWQRLAVNRKAHSDAVTALVFSPDGAQCASGGADRLVRTFQLPGLERLQSYEGHSSHVLDVAWNADNLTLASAGGDRQIKLWDIAGVKQKSKVEGFQKEVTAVEFAGATETILAASGDPTLKLANQPLPGSLGALHTAAISADGKVIIAGGRDSVLRVWDGSTRKLLREFPCEEATSNLSSR